MVVVEQHQQPRNSSNRTTSSSPLRRAEPHRSSKHLLVDRNDFTASVLDTFDGKGILLEGLVEEGVLLVKRDSVGSIRRAKY
jgi:hypothetical protein